MNDRIATNAQRIALFCKLLLPLALAFPILRWTGPLWQTSLPQMPEQTLALSLAYTEQYQNSSSELLPLLLPPLKNIPLFHRFLGFVVDGISSILLVWALLLAIKLMQSLRSNKIFSSVTTSLVATLSKIALGITLYAPIKNMLLCGIISLHNPPGLRVVSLTLGSADLVSIGIFSLLVLVSSIMQEGAKMQAESDLTV